MNRKKIQWGIVTTSAILVPQVVRAASVRFDRGSTPVGRGTEFAVDLVLDAEGSVFNALEGKIGFSKEHFTFVRAETASSIVPLWIERPVLRGDAVVFSGIIPGGFGGLHKPLEGSQLFPGTVVRLVFRAKKEGDGVLAVQSFDLAQSDGEGTLVPVDLHTMMVPITTEGGVASYVMDDAIDPALVAEVVASEYVFEGKYALVFSASDKESGIARVEVKEGMWWWREVESPYLLKDQQRKSILSVRAVDMAGNTTTVVIDPLTSGRSIPFWIILCSIVIGIYVISLFKKKQHTSNRL